MRRALLIVVLMLRCDRARGRSRSGAGHRGAHLPGRGELALASGRRGRHLDGSFVVIWTELVDFERRAYTRSFSASGASLTFGAPVDTTNDVRQTAISSLPDGTFIAAWHRVDDGASVYGRRLDCEPAPR